MSIICTCGKASGPMCNGANGCPFNQEVTISMEEKKPDNNTPNNQLPDEVLQEIDKQAEAHNARLKEHAESDKDEAYAQGFAEGWGEGATEYANKLHAEKQKTELLIKSRQNQNEWIDNAIVLLEKFISRHEGGLLPDRLLHNEIKTFLDGTK